MARESRPFTVTFDEPANHWMGIFLFFTEQHFTGNFSYTPNDFVHELIAALRTICGGCQQAIATASCNPGGYEFHFENRQERLTLAIQEYAELWGAPRKNGQNVFSATLPAKGIVRPFWLALSRLSADYPPKEYEERMGLVFPTRELQLLGEALKSIE